MSAIRGVVNAEVILFISNISVMNSTVEVDKRSNKSLAITISLIRVDRAQ